MYSNQGLPASGNVSWKVFHKIMRKDVPIALHGAPTVDSFLSGSFSPYQFMLCYIFFLLI